MMIGVFRESNYATYIVNHFQLSMHCDLDLRSFDLDINWEHPRLMGSRRVKFHDDKC